MQKDEGQGSREKGTETKKEDKEPEAGEGGEWDPQRAEAAIWGNNNPGSPLTSSHSMLCGVGANS